MLRRLGPAPLVAAILLSSSPSAAVCSKPDPKVCAEFFKSDLVFVGWVSSQRDVTAESVFDDGWSYQLQVETVFRGDAGESIEVFTPNNSSRFPLDVGGKYLLFANSAYDRIVIGDCGNSSRLADATDAIREIGKIGEATNGFIEGHVASRPKWDGVSGIPFAVRGAESTYRAITDQDGWFRVMVPPGTYRVEVESSRVTPFDLSYDRPNRVVVHKGGCAQLQFVVSEE